MRSLSRFTRLTRRAACAAAAAVVALSAAGSATRAGLVSPGQSITETAADFADPIGVLAAEGSAPFTLTYPASSAFAGLAVNGTLIDSVLRDPLDGTLTFTYGVVLDPPAGLSLAAKASRLTVGGFTSLQTDLSGVLAAQAAATLARSPDGATVEIRNVAPGQGGLPTLVVKTNATKFDTAGTAAFQAVDDLLVAGPGGASAQTVAGRADVAGVFAPTGGNPPAVPLPPAAYSGMGVLIACGLLTLTTRRPGGGR